MKLTDQELEIPRKFVRAFLRGMPHLLQHRDDLEQEGFLGLHRAAELFDPDAGFKFTTYAQSWIRSYVYRYLKSLSGFSGRRGAFKMQQDDLDVEAFQSSPWGAVDAHLDARATLSNISNRLDTSGTHRTEEGHARPGVDPKYKALYFSARFGEAEMKSGAKQLGVSRAAAYMGTAKVDRAFNRIVSEIRREFTGSDTVQAVGRNSRRYISSNTETKP